MSHRVVHLSSHLRDRQAVGDPDVQPDREGPARDRDAQAARALLDPAQQSIRPGAGEAEPARVGDLAATLHEEQIALAAEVGNATGMSVERFQTLLARLVTPVMYKLLPPDVEAQDTAVERRAAEPQPA